VRSYPAVLSPLESRPSLPFQQSPYQLHLDASTCPGICRAYPEGGSAHILRLHLGPGEIVLERSFAIAMKKTHGIFEDDFGSAGMFFIKLAELRWEAFQSHHTR